MADTQRRYNQLYETLVSGKDDLVGMIAYALYKQSKRSWLIRFEQDEGRLPTTEEISQAYVRAQGPDELARLRDQAEGLLAAYSGTVLDSETPKIRAQALTDHHLEQARRLHEQVDRNTRWYKSIPAGILSAFIYSLLLIAAVLVFRWSGIDVLGVLEKGRLPAAHGSPG